VALSSDRKDNRMMNCQENKENMAESFNQGYSICFELLSPYMLKEHNAFSIDKRRLFFEKFVLNLLKLSRVVGGDRLAIIKKLIIHNTNCCSPDTKQNLLLMEIRFFWSVYRFIDYPLI